MGVVFETVLVLEVALNLVFYQLRWHGDLNRLKQLVDDLVAGLGTLAERLGARDLLDKVCLQFVDGVELAGDLGEVVVGIRKLALLDRVHGHRDLGGFALVVATEQLGFEGGGLAGAQGVQRFVDSVDQVSGADLVGDSFGGVDLGTADGGDQVDLGEVAGLGRTVDGDQRAETREQILQFGLDLFVSHLDRVDGQLQAVELWQGELRAHIDLDGDLKVAGEVFELWKPGDVGFWTAEWADAVLFDRLAVELVQTVADSVIEHLSAANTLVDDGRRNLALAKARDVDLPGDVAVGVVDARAQLFWRHRDDELDAGGAQLFNRGLHEAASPVLGSTPCGVFCSVFWFLGYFVGATGFEPATSRSQTERSTKLSYAPGLLPIATRQTTTSAAQKKALVSLADLHRHSCRRDL